MNKIIIRIISSALFLSVFVSRVSADDFASDPSEIIVPAVLFGIIAVLLILLFIIIYRNKKSRDIETIVKTEEPEVQKTESIPEPDIVTVQNKEDGNTQSFSIDDPEIPLKEIYRITAKSIAEKYEIKHICTFTPKQMMMLAKEPSAELKEFVNLYEKMKYSPSAEKNDKNKLVSLAKTIKEQYSK